MKPSSGNIYLVCGSGGVGKTTISAALGLKHAEAGAKTLVLTIDPAKRLANSLGLKTLSNEPQKVEDTKSGGELWAMMLDTKRTFDHLVETYATTAETRDRILNNKIYQNLSSMLAGSGDYMAMEKLFEIWKQDRYDVIVLDTPPMQNALDFLSAPNRLVQMIENSMIHLLIKPAMKAGKKGFGLFERGAQQLLKAFDRITGFAFLQDISEMLLAFQDLLDGFRSRASEINDLFTSKSCEFVLVCPPESAAEHEALMFAKQLRKQKYRLSQICINRNLSGPVLSTRKLSSYKENLSEILTPEEADALIQTYKDHLPRIRKGTDLINKMQSSFQKVQISSPRLYETDIHNLENLTKLVPFL